MRRLVIQMPPRHGKSWMASTLFPIWYLGRHPDRDVLLSSYNQDLANTFGAAARDVAEQWLPAVFGLAVSNRSHAETDWRIAGRYGGMRSTGLTGTLTGTGAHLLIIDDPIKGPEEAASRAYREHLRDWYRSVAQTRLAPHGAVVICLTRWHDDDLAGWLVRDQTERHAGEPWTVLSLPALAEAHDPLGRAPGVPLWPERYDVERLAEVRQLAGSYFWNSLYQQHPQLDEGAYFRREWMRTFALQTTGDAQYARYETPAGMRHQALADCRRIMTVDLAASLAASADYFCACVWAVTPDSHLLLLDAVHQRLEGPDQLPVVRELAARWSTHVVYIERAGYQTAFVQEAVRAGLPVQPLTPDRDKALRALPASQRYRLGTVWHRAGAPWLDDLESELLAFPRGEHDDWVDCVAYAVLSEMAGGDAFLAALLLQQSRAPQTGAQQQRSRPSAPGTQEVEHAFNDRIPPPRFRP